MKKLLLMISTLLYIGAANGQICHVASTPAATVAYVFSEGSDLSMQQLFGEKILPALVNIIWINSPEKQQDVEVLVLSGKAEGVFIFPGITESETKRYCSASKYLASLIKLQEDNQ